MRWHIVYRMFVATRAVSLTRVYWLYRNRVVCGRSLPSSDGVCWRLSSAGAVTHLNNNCSGMLEHPCNVGTSSVNFGHFVEGFGTRCDHLAIDNATCAMTLPQAFCWRVGYSRLVRGGR